jgi:hypothetical protein
MATPIKRIEKEFLLKALYDEQIPVMCIYDRSEYRLLIIKPTQRELCFKADRSPEGLAAGGKIDLVFDYQGQVITFTVEISAVKNEQITAKVPEFLYKNLDRSYSRVTLPPDLQVQFTFLGDRYSLAFPKISEYEPIEIGDFLHHVDPADLNSLVNQMAAWIKDYANGYRLVVFKDSKPLSLEERIIAETGKALYLPSTLNGLPREDPFPKKRLITEEMFKAYLESTGVLPVQVNDARTRFLQEKFKSRIFSDAWVPILFHEYVIGYIHIWIRGEGKAPFDYAVIDTLFQFTKILAFSLKVNGYFDEGLLKNDPFEGKVIDISVSGLLFAYSHSALVPSLLPDTELAVKLAAPNRAINTSARIVRRYQDRSADYFGCRFVNIAPEDIRFLFELIYGKPISDADAIFLSGQV